MCVGWACADVLVFVLKDSTLSDTRSRPKLVRVIPDLGTKHLSKAACISSPENGTRKHYLGECTQGCGHPSVYFRPADRPRPSVWQSLTQDPAHSADCLHRQLSVPIKLHTIPNRPPQLEPRSSRFTQASSLGCICDFPVLPGEIWLPQGPPTDLIAQFQDTVQPPQNNPPVPAGHNPVYWSTEPTGGRFWLCTDGLRSFARSLGPAALPRARPWAGLTRLSGSYGGLSQSAFHPGPRTSLMSFICTPSLLSCGCTVFSELWQSSCHFTAVTASQRILLLLRNVFLRSHDQLFCLFSPSRNCRCLQSLQSVALPICDITLTVLRIISHFRNVLPIWWHLSSGPCLGD